MLVTRASEWGRATKVFSTIGGKNSAPEGASWRRKRKRRSEHE